MERLLLFLPPFGAGLALVLAVSALLDTNRRLRRTTLAAIYLAIGVILLHGHWFHSRTLIEFPWFFRAQVPFVFLIGPLLWLHIQMRLDPDFEPDHRQFWHLLPAGLTAIAWLLWFLSSGDGNARRAALAAAYEHPARDPGLLAFAIGLVFTNAYVFAAARRLINLLEQPGQHRLSAGLLLALLLSLPGFSILTAIGLYLREPTAVRIQLVGITMTTICFFLIRHRFPGFFVELQKADQKERYAQRQLSTDSIDITHARIEALIDADEFFREPDLTLADLAELTELTPHQLSEYLNLHREIGFRGFVNQLRVECAARLLLEERERTVLSIAYEVGFRSKSAFNRIFLEETGRTPTSYRRDGVQTQPPAQT